MFKSISIILISLALVACASSVELPDGTKMPAALYANQMQIEHAANSNRGVCEDMKPMQVSDIPKGTEDMAWAINSISWSNAALADKCSQAKAAVAAANRQRGRATRR